MESYSFLFWAYNVVWLGLALYLLGLLQRMRKVDRRLDGLERRQRATRQKSSDS